MAFVMSISAQNTAVRWLEAARWRSEALARTVSGEGEGAEIMGTIIGMLAQREAWKRALETIAAGDGADAALARDALK